MDELTGKRIVILGLARQGRALARFAAGVGAKVIVSDLSEAPVPEAVLATLRDDGIEIVLGEHPLRLLDNADVLAISGGVPPTIPIVRAARERGIRISNDSLEFLRRCPAPTVGITGSSGKTTTTTLTGEMGRAAGRQTWIGGNIGRPLIAELERITSSDLVVQELSSFQLEIWSPEWGNEGRSPDVAAVLNVTPNHLDRHRTMEAYAAAKANIVRFQKLEQVAVLSADDEGALALSRVAGGRVRTFSRRSQVDDGAFEQDGKLWLRSDGAQKVICRRSEIRLRGDHNVSNVLAAVTLADSAGLDTESMREVITTFAGVAHRLEQVAVVDGVQYVNDSIATAPERALAAIEAYDEPLVLLAGGQDKEMHWDEWVTRVAERVHHVVLFGELAEMLERRLQVEMVAPSEALTRVETLQEAVQAAHRVARPGDVVLLAPGGTSYDAFKDFEERGELYRQLVRAL